MYKNKRLKIVVLAAVSFILAIFIAGGAAAAGTGTQGVIEAPQVRVVIDGVPGVYTDVALEINGRILLPFREVLARLGVPNDSEHIIWNDGDETVTVLYGKDVIKLKVGSQTMTLNGKEINFDAAPYFYHKNDRTYVPVRAISELLGKLIMWEESTSTVYIRDKANYDETLDLLKRMRGAKEITKIQSESISKVNVSIKTDNAPFPGSDKDGVLRTEMEMTQLVQADLDLGVYHVTQTTDIGGTSIGTEVFIYKDKAFTKVDGSGAGWTDVTDQNSYNMESVREQINIMENQMDARALSDVAMGFAVSVGGDGSYMLVGEPISLTEINTVLDTVSALLPKDDPSAYSMKFNRFMLATVYNDKLHPVSSGVSADFDLTIKDKADNGKTVAVYIKMEINMSITYDEVDSSFTVPIPSELSGRV